MTWDKDNRRFTMNYSPTVLRDLIYLSAEHYEVVNYCPITKDIINHLGQFETAKYWAPTLTYYNGFYCIQAINSCLHEAIKDIPFNDDLKTIAMLSKHGVKIDDSVVNHLSEKIDINKIKFAATFHVEHELKDLNTAFEWLTELGCDGIIKPKVFLQSLFQMNGIELNISTPNDLSSCTNPAMIYYKGNLSMLEEKPSNVLKIIKCVNSEPVNLGTK